MKKRFSKLALLFGAVLAAAALATPVFAQDPEPNPDICAILTDSRTGTSVVITRFGTAFLVCCGTPILCGEGFLVCVDGKPEIGAVSAVNDVMDPGDFTTNTLNLNPLMIDNDDLSDPKKNPFNFCRPFVQTTINDKGKPKTITTFLTPIPETEPPVFDVSNPTAEENEEDAQPLPPGTIVNVVIENRPANGKCIGVRTTIQFKVGTCMLWKIRKFFNTCKDKKRITQIKEFELPCGFGLFTTLAGPGGSRIAAANLANGNLLFPLLTVAPGGNLGAKVSAGSFSVEDLFTHGMNPVIPGEFQTCRPTSSFTSSAVTTTETDAPRFLEIFLDFAPGVFLMPAGKSGSEKFVDFHIDVH